MPASALFDGLELRRARIQAINPSYIDSRLELNGSKLLLLRRWDGQVVGVERCIMNTPDVISKQMRRRRLTYLVCWAWGKVLGAC